MKRVYGTWVDDNGVRHYASGVKRDEGLSDHRGGDWFTYMVCGGRVYAAPREPKAVVTCFRCLWKTFRPSNPRDVLRGQMADLVIIDEAQDITRYLELLEKVGLFSLLPPPPKAP